MIIPIPQRYKNVSEQINGITVVSACSSHAIHGLTPVLHFANDFSFSAIDRRFP